MNGSSKRGSVFYCYVIGWLVTCGERINLMLCSWEYVALEERNEVRAGWLDG